MRQDILNLGAIVLLRSLLNYFLEQEIRRGEERREAQAGSDATGTVPRTVDNPPAGD